MAFKQILLHMDDTPRCVTRLDAALRLARQHGACLTGLYVITHPHYAPQSEAAERRAEEARALFQERASAAGVETLWHCADWHVTGVPPGEIVCLHAFYTDLVILGGPAPDSADSGSLADFAERLVVGCGRPVLVIPHAAKCDSIGERVLVAWKGGRESVRSANDAMTILERAERVRLITIVNEADKSGEGASSCARMCAHLERHRVNADFKAVAVSALGVGDLLLNTVSDEGSDLLVLGAYDPRSRGPHAAGEISRYLLRHSPVPLFLSH
jgi:nucleotide-binding universal stress UspA family protein